MPSSLFQLGKLAPLVRQSRILRGELFADIIEDHREQTQIVFCIVQRHGSSEVLFLGQFFSQPEAESAAVDFMSDYKGWLRRAAAD